MNLLVPDPMKKRDWLLVLSVVVMVWLIDQVTKAWAVNHLGPLTFYGPFGHVLHRNPGAMLGMFSDLPPLLRIVSLSTGGAFLIFIYGAVQHLLPRRSMQLRIGMSLLLGGILGNVTDRIAVGSVDDFLVLRAGSFTSPAFNPADALQWVGYALVVLAVIFDGNQLWPENNVRKKMWIQPKFQLKYIGILIAIGVGFAVISGVFSYTFLKVTIDDLVIGQPQAIERKFLYPFLFTYMIISLAFVIILFIIGRRLSHRTAGPIYAFEKFLDDVLAGRDRELKLRAGDDFGHLEELAERVRYELRENRPVSASLSTEESDDSEPGLHCAAKK